MPTTLCTQKLSEEIRQTKSASTAKGYLAAINKLEEFFGRDVISINDFTTTFIEDFSKFLIAEGLSAATTSLYLRNLRALLKKSLGVNDKEVLRQVFKGVSSKNGKSSAAIGISDLTRLASADLSAYPPLRRIRSLFLFSFYACGLPIGYIRLLPKSLPASGCIPLPQNHRVTIVPQLSEVITRFETENSSNFVEYAASISEADYAQGLEAIGVLMKLPVRLTPTSAAESWVAIALESGIALEHIAAIINDTTPITKHISASACHTPGVIPEKIANRVNDTSERWYAMRCFDSTPAEMQAKLAAEELAVDTFIPVQANTATTLAKDRLMSSLLFFRTSATNASVLKSRIAPGAYVFSFSSSDKKPAYIPNDQMLTFMFLVNIGADTILYYYPSENGSSQQFEPKDIVEITDGSFCGNVGIVERLSKDRLRVCVRIEALNGALISAEIPAKFLKKRNMKFPADQQQLRILSDNELRIAVETANACRDQAEADTTLCALYSEIERRISCYPLDVETVFTLYELLYGGDELSAPPEKQLATLSHAVANIYRNRDRATFADVHRYIAFLFMALLYVPDKKAEIEYEISHIFDTWMAAYIPGTGWPDTDSAETRRRSSTLLASEAYLSYPRYLSARTALTTQ